MFQWLRQTVRAQEYSGGLSIFKGIVQRFGKYAYFFSWKENKEIDTSLTSVCLYVRLQPVA